MLQKTAEIESENKVQATEVDLNEWIKINGHSKPDKLKSSRENFLEREVDLLHKLRMSDEKIAQLETKVRL